MLPTLIAAALVGALAPILRSFAWGVPFGLLSIATVLRSFVGSALTVLVIGTVAFFVLRATPMEPDEVANAAGTIGATLGVLLLMSSVQRMRRVRGLSVLCQRLGELDVQPEALEALERLLERARRADPERHVGLVLMATGPLTQAGLWAEAREQLRSLDDDLTEAQSVLRNQALATCELRFDDVEAAQSAIDRIQRPTEPSIEVWLVAMEALLMAVRGETEEALAHLGAQDSEDNPSLRASHRLVHAHIYAARGDQDAAERELQALAQEAGRAGLERVVRPRGPASPLAERVLDRDPQSG
jgi:hypothetical protein